MARAAPSLFPGRMMKPLSRKQRSAETASLQMERMLHELHGLSEYLPVTYGARSEHGS